VVGIADHSHHYRSIQERTRRLILFRYECGESMDDTTTANSDGNAKREPVKATILNVLIASPSDVPTERDAVESAIHEWNANHHTETGIILLPVRWETHSYPGSGDRPQAILNKQIVDSGHLLIGIFGNRLGTPLATEMPKERKGKVVHPGWKPRYKFEVPAAIIDPNGNVQVVSGVKLPDGSTQTDFGSWNLLTKHLGDDTP
jgi:hypothetical protein